MEKTLRTTVVESVLSGPLIRTAADREEDHPSAKRSGLGAGGGALGKGRGTRGHALLPIVVSK